MSWLKFMEIGLGSIHHVMAKVVLMEVDPGGNCHVMAKVVFMEIILVATIMSWL